MDWKNWHWSSSSSGARSPYVIAIGVRSRWARELSGSRDQACGGGPEVVRGRRAETRLASCVTDHGQGGGSSRLALQCLQRASKGVKSHLRRTKISAVDEAIALLRIYGFSTVLFGHTFDLLLRGNFKGQTFPSTTYYLHPSFWRKQ